jgi:hypothetical protein
VEVGAGDEVVVDGDGDDAVGGGHGGVSWIADCGLRIGERNLDCGMRIGKRKFGLGAV